MPQPYLSHRERDTFLSLLRHSVAAHTNPLNGSVSISFRAPGDVVERLIQTIGDFKDPVELGQRLGPVVHRAISEGDGLCDALDVVLDEMDEEERAAIFDRARNYLGLPAVAPAADELAEQGGSYAGARESDDVIPDDVIDAVAAMFGLPRSLIQVMSAGQAPPARHDEGFPTALRRLR